MQIQDKNFEGAILTDVQQKEMKMYMKSNLGEEDYKLVENFFFTALDYGAKYVVVGSQRCYILMNLFYRTIFNKPDERFEEHFLTIDGLLANIPLIAYRYIALGSIQKILIVDDILVYGKEISYLIDIFIQALKDYLEAKGFEYSLEDLEREVKNAIDIRVMIQNDKPLLMKSTYYQKTMSNENKPNIKKPSLWHEFLSQIMRVTTKGIFSNAKYSISLYGDTNVKNLVEDTVKQLGFLKSVWNERYVDDVWVKALKRDNNEIIAFYTYHIVQNDVDKSFHIIPFILGTDMELSSSETLLKNVFGEKLGGELISPYLPKEVKAEFVYLVLNYNLLLLLQKENVISKDKLDIDKIRLNYGNDTIFSKGFEELLKFDKAFLSWEQINAYLLTATRESKCLISNEQSGVLCHNISDILEESIAKEKEEIDRIAYLESSGQKSNSKEIKFNSVQNLLNRVTEQKGLSENDTVKLVGSLLRQIKRGYVIDIPQIQKIQGIQYITNMYYITEAASFIELKKYSDYLCVLYEMESDCSYNCDRLIERINKFYKDEKGIKTNLENLVRMLYSSGQKIFDWDINWLLWTEIDEETVRIFGDKSQEDLIISQMILRSLNNSDALKEYRKVFPKR